MENTIDLRTFLKDTQQDYILSTYEKLQAGQNFRFLCDQDPESFRREFVRLKVQNFSWKVHKIKEATWEVEFGKLGEQQTSGCCGICGGSGHG